MNVCYTWCDFPSATTYCWVAGFYLCGIAALVNKKSKNINETNKKYTTNLLIVLTHILEVCYNLLLMNHIPIAKNCKSMINLDLCLSKKMYNFIYADFYYRLMLNLLPNNMANLIHTKYSNYVTLCKTLYILF